MGTLIMKSDKNMLFSDFMLLIYMWISDIVKK